MDAAAAPSVPESAPEIVSRETLDALVSLIDEVRKAPRSQVVRLGGMKPSPGADRIGEATGRVCVAVDGEAVLVAPKSGCNRCNGSPAFRFRAMREGEAVTHPCECVSRQIRKVAPAPKFPTMAEKGAAGGATEAPAAPAPVAPLADERRAHLTRRLEASKRVLGEAVDRMADAIGPHEANVAERYALVMTASGAAEDCRARHASVEVAARAIRDEIADVEARLARLRSALADVNDNSREVAVAYDVAAQALTDAEASHRDAVAERDKVARRRQKDVDRAAEDVSRLERKIAECGA